MSRYTHWRDDEVVDGGGLPLDKHAEGIAHALNLTEEQQAILLAELRNALVPVLHAEDLTAARKGSERILVLTRAIQNHRSPAHKSIKAPA